MKKRYRGLDPAIVFVGLLVVSMHAPATPGVGPQPLAMPPPIPMPRDAPFSGTIALNVDATDVAHKIMSVHEVIPVQASGPVTLLYPAWETASHAETASVGNLAGLVVTIDGTSVPWHRDAVDMHAFHIDVPVGAHAIGVDFQYLRRGSDGVMTTDLVDVQWHRVLLYPAGWFARNIEVAATLTMPAGLKAFTSLDAVRTNDGAVTYMPVSLDILTDAPVHAARYWRQALLSAKGAPAVWLDMLAEKPENIAATDADIASLRELVVQTRHVLGPAHYDHYDAIVTLSDAYPSGGIEHRALGEDNLPSNYFTEGNKQLNNRDLIAHEHVHSWNGLYRQPADLWTPTLNVPMRDSLLWVYEGQTEFWGRILAARSRLRTRQETLDKLALDAAVVDTRVGRAWKNLQDTSNDPLYMAGHPVAWRDWQRREDYYPEGVILWLGVDAKIRELTGGHKSLNDFARDFFATQHASQATATYTFDDVVAELERVAPFDWKNFLQTRLDTHDPLVIADLERTGWALVYTDTPTATFLQDEADAGAMNLTYSIGLSMTSKGSVSSVSWHGPAFDAGLAPGARIVAINGKPYTDDAMLAAVRNAASQPIALKFETNGQTHDATLGYRGTLRYPHLQRITGKPDRLVELLAPLPAR